MIPGIGKPQLTVGSAPNCDIVIQGPGVGGHHLTLAMQGPSLVATDMGTPGGSMHGNAPLVPGTPTPIQHTQPLSAGQAQVPLNHPAVGLLLQRIERFPRFAIVIDDMDALGDLATCGAGLAELETLVAMDRRIGLLHHLQEDIRLRENLLDRGGGVGIGGRGIIAAKGLLLRADDILCGSDVVGEGRRSEPDQEDHEESKSAHADIPWLMQLITAKSAESCIHRARGARGYWPLARRRRPDAVRPSSPSRRTA